MNTITAIHGWTYDTSRWKPFIDLLHEKKIPLELLPVPGLTAPLSEPWTLHQYVEWLHKKLQTSKNPAVLLGHSNGGRIAITYAAKYPERVRHLILIDSAGIYHRDIRTRLKKSIFRSFAAIGKQITHSDKMRKILYKIVREEDYYNANETVRKTMTRLIETDCLPLLPRLSMPVTIVWGSGDTITPLTDAKVLNEHIPTSSLHIIPGARHSPMYTHPEEVSIIIAQQCSQYGSI